MVKHSVYKTRCHINNKFYIGIHSSKNPFDGYLGSGYALKSSIEKYGRENFSKQVLVICENREESSRVEELLIRKYLGDRSCYNLCNSGTHKKHRKVNQSKENNPMYGKRHTLKSKEQISKNKKGKALGQQSSEHKEKRRTTKLLNYVVTSPAKETFYVSDLPSFCKVHNLNYKRMSKLARRKNNRCVQGICSDWTCSFSI